MGGVGWRGEKTLLPVRPGRQQPITINTEDPHPSPLARTHEFYNSFCEGQEATRTAIWKTKT